MNYCHFLPLANKMTTISLDAHLQQLAQQVDELKKEIKQLQSQVEKLNDKCGILPDDVPPRPLRWLSEWKLDKNKELIDAHGASPYKMFRNQRVVIQKTNGDWKLGSQMYQHRLNIVDPSEEMIQVLHWADKRLQCLLSRNGVEMETETEKEINFQIKAIHISLLQHDYDRLLQMGLGTEPEECDIQLKFQKDSDWTKFRLFLTSIEKSKSRFVSAVC